MNSISKKVLLGYLLILVVVIAASVTLFSVTSEVKHRTEKFIGQTLPELNNLQQVKQSLDVIQIASYSLYGTIIEAEEFTRVLNENEVRLAKLLDVNGLLAEYREHKSIVEEVKVLISVMNRLKGIMLTEEVDWDSARNTLTEVDKYAKKLTGQLIAINKNVSFEASLSSKAISTEIADIQMLVIALLVSIVTVAVVAYILSHKKIALPIRELASGLDLVAKNYDLTITVPKRSNDEVGIAAESVNRLLKSFNSGITDVRNAANNINGLVEVLGTSSENADVQVRLLNEKIELLLTSMMTLEEQIEQGFRQSNSASDKAKVGAQEVEQGAEQVANTSSSISALAHDLETLILPR